MRRRIGVLLSASTLLAFPTQDGSLSGSARYARNSSPPPVISDVLPSSLRRRRELANFIDKLQAILLIDPDAIYQFQCIADAAIEEMQDSGQWLCDEDALG